MPQKSPKRFTQNRQTVVNKVSRGIWRCLKHDRDIGRKALLSDVKTAFTYTPALIIDKIHNRRRRLSARAISRIGAVPRYKMGQFFYFQTKLRHRLRHTRAHAARFLQMQRGERASKIPEFFMYLVHNSTRLFLLEFCLSIFVVSCSNSSGSNLRQVIYMADTPKIGQYQPRSQGLSANRGSINLSSLQPIISCLMQNYVTQFQ